MSSSYYNPFRAWYQRHLYGPVEAFWNRWGASLPIRLDERIGAWLYRACGAGRPYTRKEAARRRAYPPSA